MGDQTWANIITRDREDGVMATHIEVVNVLHNENPNLWGNYMRARAGIRSCEIERINVSTSQAHPALGELDAEINEFLLFHGTKPSAADAICRTDFKISLAGSGAGTLYGDGVYLAEKSSKSDEYAKDDEDGPYQGLYAMLLCRAVCGNMFHCDEVRPNVELLMEKCESADYHSVLGDREKARGTYREFILYDHNQV